MSRVCTRIGSKWTTPRYKAQWQQICAITPEFLYNGTNGTIITYIDGSKDAIENRINWVVDDLLRYQRSSLPELVKHSRAYLGKKARRVPLVLSETFTLMPIKAREIHSKNEGAVGYVVMSHVQDIVADEKSNIIRCTNGVEVRALDYPEVLANNFRLAKNLQRMMEQDLAGLDAPHQYDVRTVMNR